MSENKFPEFINNRTRMPESVVNIIPVGCVFWNEEWRESQPGVVTDFKLFGRILSKQELEDWAGPAERRQGDVEGS